MIEALKDAVANGGNMVMFGRSLEVKAPDLHAWVIASTPFLTTDCKFNERVYCLINDIRERLLCQYTGKERRFINYFTGYRDASSSGRSKNRAEKKATVVKERRGKKKRLPAAQVEELLSYARIVGSDDTTHGSKVKKFINRNRQRNSDLYDLPDTDEGTAYVVCPVLGIRTLNIKRPYVEGVLLMSWDDFVGRYPDAKLHCAGHTERVSVGLMVEVEPGLTKHQAAMIKATAVKKIVGEDGLTIDQRKGHKTRETHMQRGDDGMTGYERLAHYRNTTILDNGLSVQQNGLKKRHDAIVAGEFKRSFGASAASRRHLAPLLEWLEEEGIKYYFGDREYAINDGENYYFFDLVIPTFDLCVEYQSNAYHADPRMSDQRWLSWRPARPKDSVETAASRTEYDLNKARALYRTRGFNTWFVWENSVGSDVGDILLHMKEKHVCREQPV